MQPQSKPNKAVIVFSNIGYVIGCVALYVIALWIIGASIKTVIDDLLHDAFNVYSLLDEVGLIVFSIAVIDVSKYLLIEEVIHFNEQKDLKKMKQALSKFVIIIATALSLKGLVLTIETAKADISQIYYSVSVIITAILFIIGLGIYQKLDADSERKTKNKS